MESSSWQWENRVSSTNPEKAATTFPMYLHAKRPTRTFLFCFFFYLIQREYSFSSIPPRLATSLPRAKRENKVTCVSDTNKYYCKYWKYYCKRLVESLDTAAQIRNLRIYLTGREYRGLQNEVKLSNLPITLSKQVKVFGPHWDETFHQLFFCFWGLLPWPICSC